MDGIQFRQASQETFVDPPVTAKPSSPPLIKIADIDITETLNEETTTLDSIDSLTALKMLDYLVNHLIILAEQNSIEANESEEVKNESPVRYDGESSTEEDIPCEDSPLSPKKQHYNETDHDYILIDTNTHDKPKLPAKSQQSALVQRFVLRLVPELTPTEYLERINRYCGLSSAVYLTCIHYLYKLVCEWKILQLTKFNVHRLLIAGLRISCKTLEDINHRQQFIAKIGGVKLDDLKLLEVSFLFLLNFDCQSNASLLTETVENVKQVFRAE